MSFGAKEQYPVQGVEAGVSPERNGESDHQSSWEEVSPREGGGSIRGGGRTSLLSEALGQSGLHADKWKQPCVVVGHAGLCDLNTDGDGPRTGEVFESILYVVLLFCDFENTHRHTDRHIHIEFKSPRLEKKSLELWVEFITYEENTTGHIGLLCGLSGGNLRTPVTVFIKCEFPLLCTVSCFRNYLQGSLCLTDS